MLSRKLLALFLFFFAAGAIAQDTLYSIEYQGLKRTREVYLRNFVIAETGVPLDTAALSQSVKNMLNTNLYATAELTMKDTLDGVKAIIKVKEKWSVFPTASWGVIDDNFWVQGGWHDNHFLGRGIRHGLVLRYYDRFAVEGYFKAPYWFRNSWGMESNWFFGRTIEPIQFPEEAIRYNEDRQMFNLLLSYALKPNNLLYAGYELEISNFHNRDELPDGSAAVLNEVQRKHNLVLRHHNRHNLNIVEQYLSGWANEIIVKASVVPDGDRWYPYLRNDLKIFFRPWKTGNIGSRTRIGLAENNSSVFAQFIQDSFINVRGIGNKPFRGTAELTENLELRQTVYDRSWLAVQAIAFCDYSVVRPPGGELKEMFAPDNNRMFAGVGGRISFKKGFDFILRMDYGFSLTDGKGGFVLGAGQYF